MTYEVGYIKKMFEEMELNWGTYDYHCNAHLDNLLVLPFNEKKLYLAPLDFDLGFTRAEFIDLNYKNAKGIENNLNFDELLEREKNNFTVQLLGFNPIPNIDVKVLAIEKTLYKNTNYKLMIENILMIAYYTDILRPLYILSKECQKRTLTLCTLRMAIISFIISLQDLRSLDPFDEDSVSDSIIIEDEENSI